jgi:UDP-N-acetylglucosamine 4,6-dehydratase (inverting)
MSEFDDKVILLTGGTGSFGQKFTEVLLKEHNPKAIRIYSRGELLQMQMEQRFKEERLRFFIGDVRDQARLNRAMNGADIVIHAAALKHVPACEYNPLEAVKTNIEGTANVINTAIDNGIRKVMVISTDKAVHPVNLYGATKMVAEKITVQGNSYTGDKKTCFSCVRYGNVIGSRGSVIPVFKEQMKSGVITLTDERMTRFWITLDQGIHFVIECIERMEGGEIFIPKIPSMKLMDLAEAIAPHAEKKFTGIRPGEKLHEVLLTEDEARHAREYNSYFIIEPEHKFWNPARSTKGKELPDNFRYDSCSNTQWLSIENLCTIVAQKEKEEAS